MALDRKIARERIGVEMAGCFDGSQPLLSAEYLLELGIFSIVFEAPQKSLDVIGRGYSEPCLKCLRMATPILVSHPAVVCPAPRNTCHTM